MASDKPANVNKTLPTYVRVKLEPGTSTSVPTAPLDDASLKTIKMEPGLSTSTQRLTSFRLPRDLTLGGTIKTEKSKKLYMPNLNVQRNKKKEETTTKAIKVESVPSKSRERGRGRGRGHDKNLIQSVGVWSEGINIPTIRRSYSSSRDRNVEKDYANSLEKPKLDLNKVIDMSEEEKKLRKLLRNTSIDENDDIGKAPIILPPQQKDIFLKKDKEELDVEKNEEVDEQIDFENEIKIKMQEMFKAETLAMKKEDSIYDVINNKNNSYLLLEFPSSFPKRESNQLEGKPDQPELSKHKQKYPKSKPEFCTLHDLKPGFLGKIQFLKSGKARLRFEAIDFTIDNGFQLSTYQELIAAKVDTTSSTGDLINLGTVTNTLRFVPDWFSIMKNK